MRKAAYVCFKFRTDEESELEISQTAFLFLWIYKWGPFSSESCLCVETKDEMFVQYCTQCWAWAAVATSVLQ